MPSLRILTAAEQVASYLREELARGVRTGKMPGAASLSRDLGVGRMTVDTALEILEEDGILIAQGAGRNRLIAESVNNSSALKIAFLPFLSEDVRADYVMDIERLLQEAGHTVIFLGKSISELNSDTRKISRLMEITDADAWVVIAGPRNVLSWFAEQSLPTFALFGRRRGLPMASVGPDKETAYRELVRHLVKLGHRRISLLTRPLRRLPEPGFIERAFLDELELSGIRTSTYHLPEWDGQAETIPQIMDSMMKVTPPTALLIDEPPVYFSVQYHLARSGILAPQDISLACSDGDPYFEFLRPSVAHVKWDSRPWIRRVLSWVNSVSLGKKDLRQTLSKSEYVPGDSVGKAP
ncbi:MAG: substrate-binding domain-containing protein [Akkermansiaceae bacterium]